MKQEKINFNKNELLEQFIELMPTYNEFVDYMYKEISNLMIDSKIKFQSMQSRVKEYKSLSKKLDKKEIIEKISNNNIKSIKDLAGLRIIFYDEKEIKNAIAKIEEEYKNPEIKAPEKEEYDAWNITITISNKTSKFYGLKCEIQLVTIIQHAIIESQHNIIYKDIDNLEKKNFERYSEIKNLFIDVNKEGQKIQAYLQTIRESCICKQ